MKSRRRIGPRSERPPAMPIGRPHQGGAPRRGMISVGALAVGDRRANAVGPVRITCERDSLLVELFGVGRFSAGFAFATLADAVSFRVPYRAVRGMVRDGRSMLLSLDPQVAAPYSRFALTRFTKEPMEALMRAYRVRAVASFLSYLLPLPLAAAAVFALERRELAGVVGLSAVGLIVAFVAFRALRGLVAWLGWGGPISDRLRDSLESAISGELGLTPSPDLVRPAVPEPPPPVREPVRVREVMGTILRPAAFAVVATMALVLGAGSLVAVKRYGIAEQVILPVDDARTGIAAPIRAVAAAGVQSAMTTHPSCSCARVDSSLWREGLPQLSVMVSPVAGHIDTVWLKPNETYAIRYGEGERPRAELDLAVVNNSTATFKTLDLVLTFAFRDEGGARRNLRERGLHWPAKLGPGESVRWRVKAPGTEVKLETRHDTKLSAVEMAGPEAFYPLGRARIPVVRLHGAIMLAMLRDARAPALAAAAGELGGAAAKARTELTRTLSPLVACDVTPAEIGFTACVFNGDTTLHRSLSVVGTDAEGGEQSHRVSDFFHPGEGLHVRVPWPASGKTISVAP